MSEFGQGGNILNIFCITARFITICCVVITAVLGEAHFTKCYPSREVARHARTCDRHFSDKKEIFRPLQEIGYLDAYETRDKAQPGKTVKQLTT